MASLTLCNGGDVGHWTNPRRSHNQFVFSPTRSPTRLRRPSHQRLRLTTTIFVVKKEKELSQGGGWVILLHHNFFYEKITIDWRARKIWAWKGNGRIRQIRRMDRREIRFHDDRTVNCIGRQVVAAIENRDKFMSDHGLERKRFTGNETSQLRVD